MSDIYESTRRLVVDEELGHQSGFSARNSRIRDPETLDEAGWAVLLQALKLDLCGEGARGTVKSTRADGVCGRRRSFDHSAGTPIHTDRPKPKMTRLGWSERSST
jgi:hypothetical protein